MTERKNHMEYIYLAGACFCFSIQFIFNKLFSSRSNGTFLSGVWCALATALCMLVYLLPMGGFALDISCSALICSVLYTASSLLCTGITILAMKLGKLSVVTTYTLLGGLILPFLWGLIAYHEPFGFMKGIGIVILLLSMISGVVWDKLFPKETAPAEKTNSGLRFHFYCLILFMTNGIVSIATTASQKAADAVSSDAFLILCKIETALAAVIIMLIIGCMNIKKGNRNGIHDAFFGISKELPMTAKTFLILVLSCALFAVCNGAGNILSLNCAKTMDASIQFPVISAVVIVLGALFGLLFFHEKIEKRDITGLILAAAGIVFFIV